MKKLLLSLFTLLLALGIKAETVVTFDFDNDATALFGIEGRSSGSGNTYVADGEFNENGVATIDGVTVTVEASPADAANRNRLWTSSPVLRMYTGALTVSAPGHVISTIKFTTGSNFNISSAVPGTLTGKVWTADEATETVVFNIQKNTQIKSIDVTLDAQGAEPVVLPGTGEGTLESPYDVVRARAIIDEEMVTSAKVYVKGTISSVEEINLTYGNATYNLGQDDQTLKVYRGMSLGGKPFKAEDEIKAGDEVIVLGTLVTNYGGQITTGSEIISLNGQTYTEPEYTPIGNGTLENPYTVADIQGMGITESDGEKYWVKGFILGSVSSATKLNDDDKEVDTNIGLGASADATTFIPVALPAGDMRTALGVATNTSNIGREVMVYGTLEKYFNTSGVKNVSDYKFVDASGIQSATVEAGSKAIYNINGQRVDRPAKGIFIIDGKKVLVK